MSQHGGAWISRNGDWYPNTKVANNGAVKTLKERGLTHIPGHDQKKVQEDLTVLNQPTSRNIVKEDKKNG